MSSLYSATIQEPPTTGVELPVSCQLRTTSNSSSTSSSEVFSFFSVGSSTSSPVTWPSRMLPTPASVTVVWSEHDRSWVDAMPSSRGLLRGYVRAGAGVGPEPLVAINGEHRCFASDTSPARLLHTATRRLVVSMSDTVREGRRAKLG